MKRCSARSLSLPSVFCFFATLIFFFFFDSFLSFICLSVRSSISYHMLLMNQNVESVFHPWQAPSSCEEAAVCLAASAATYQRTYFRWLVPHAVIQWQEKTWAFCIILVCFLAGGGACDLFVELPQISVTSSLFLLKHCPNFNIGKLILFSSKIPHSFIHVLWECMNEFL